MYYLRWVLRDAADRVRRACPLLRVGGALLTPLGPLPVLAANTIPFEPVETLSPEQASSVDQIGGSLDFQNWVDRGMTVRRGDSVYSCLANLTAALDLVGELSTAEYNGASGALSLLPTAGALLGAPTREMWVVYKLVPLAGVMSMFLSLGGSITPSNVGDFDPSEPFSYGGFMPTTGVRTSSRQKRSLLYHQATGSDAHYPLTASTPTIDDAADQRDTMLDIRRDAQRFAHEVRERADDDRGGGIRMGVFFAMMLQVVLVVAMLIPMWYAQRGAVIPWWCRVWGWMYFWYFLVSAVSIFDNLVAAPFTRSWSIRVSRRPTGILLDESVRKVTDRSRYGNALEAIRSGPNTNQHVRVHTDRGSGYSRTCFYVVISIQGISRLHAIAQVVAKAASVAVFAFGTALFASSTLMSISVALMVLCLLLTCGVAGRVIAMWIVAQISRENKPILHKLVTTEREGGEYIHAIAELDLQLEINGHVIVDGWCVHSRSQLFSASTYIGLLARPFDVLGLARKQGRSTSDVAPTMRGYMQSPSLTRMPTTQPSSESMAPPGFNLVELNRYPQRSSQSDGAYNTTDQNVTR